VSFAGFLFFCFLSAASGAEPLRPEDAFRASAYALDGRTIELGFEIAEGYYLYRDKFRFSVESADVRLGQAVFPKGRETEDETFGKTEVYDRQVSIRLPVERDDGGPLSLNLQVGLQGCAAELGICYPPQKQSIVLELPEAVRSASTPVAVESDESGRIARMLGEATFGWAALSFFGFGLLLSATPCVFPMFPILSGLIVGASGGERSVSRGRAFALSLAYVTGMAVVYAVAGVVAGLSGTLVSAALQNVWVLGGFALVFVVLALSMFGLFELRLPSCLQVRVTESAARRGGSLPGVALMGGLSALIVGPCVAAPLAGALLYIGGTGDALFGGLALFCLAWGMGVPLLVIGASAGALLPRAGPWMLVINRIFGVVLLACALWIVSPLVPVFVQMLAWGALSIVSAVFLRAVDPLPRRAGGWQRLGKAVGVILLLFGAAMLIGAFSGARDPWRPLAALGRVEVESSVLSFTRIRSLGELDDGLVAAGRPTLLDFYADWCVSCRQMDRSTFSDSRVRERLAGWRLLRVDVTADLPDDRALLARFGLFGPPGIIFFDSAGREVQGVRVIGYQSPEEFIESLDATGF
jgi:thiol:disulfide interchange protein DsbD